MEIYSVVFFDDTKPKPMLFRDKRGAFEFFRKFLLNSENGGWWDDSGALDFDALLDKLDEWYLDDNVNESFKCWATEDSINRFIFRHSI